MRHWIPWKTKWEYFPFMCHAALHPGVLYNLSRLMWSGEGIISIAPMNHSLSIYFRIAITLLVASHINWYGSGYYFIFILPMNDCSTRQYVHWVRVGDVNNTAERINLWHHRLRDAYMHAWMVYIYSCMNFRRTIPFHIRYVSIYLMLVMRVCVRYATRGPTTMVSTCNWRMRAPLTGNLCLIHNCTRITGNHLHSL